MVSLVQTLVWAGVVVFGIWRMAQVLERFAPVDTSVAPVDEVVDVPDDLAAFAMQEQEAWAQEDVMRAVRERYIELRDWNKVRMAVGIGRIDP